MAFVYEDTENKIRLTVFSTLYVDWGLTISDTETGEELWSNPHCLSNESTGFTDPEDIDEEKVIEWLNLHEDDAPEGDEWSDEDIAAAREKMDRVPWGDEEWRDYLQADCSVLVDAYIGWDEIEKRRAEKKANDAAEEERADESDEWRTCPFCGSKGPHTLIGKLGILNHLRCRACGYTWGTQHEVEVDADGNV
jgi:hypothetical protein